MPIKIPEVPDDQPDLPFSATNGTQTIQMLHATLGSILEFQGEINDEMGIPKVDILSSNRVLLTSPNGNLQFVAYMSDKNVDARLVIDDYIPELHEGP